MGLEPTVSTLTGWRALRTAPRGPKVPGEGLEPPNSWVRARCYYRQQLPRIVLCFLFRHGQASPGSGRRTRTSTSLLQRQGAYRLANPRIATLVYADLRDWRSGRGGSRTPKAHRSADFESAAVARRLALPSREKKIRRQESNLRPPGQQPGARTSTNSTGIVGKPGCDRCLPSRLLPCKLGGGDGVRRQPWGPVRDRET